MGSGKKGSQLAQLRSGLREAGVTGPRSKKGRGGDSDSRVGKYRAEQRRRRLDSLMGSLNAFDEKVTHQKHDVPGRKIKGTQGRPSAAKSDAMQQRRAKLLPELASRHHSSNFVDRRFGEYDPKLSLEDKMLQRFTAERQKRAAKTSLFDLNDDEGADDITHFGQSLSGLDEMPDVALEEDDEDDERGAKGKIDEEATRAGHFAGFDDEDRGGAPRSKHEVMKDIIAKSKLAKYERQKARDADEEMRMELDEELGDIRSLLYTKPLAPEGEPQEEQKPAQPSADAPDDQYDAFVRELAYERRAKPQDRLRSAEELVEQQAERLRAAEAARLKRMRGEPADEEEAEAAAGADEALEEPEEPTGRSRFGLGHGLEERGTAQEDEEDEEMSEGEDEEEGEEGEEDEESEEGEEADEDEDGEEDEEDEEDDTEDAVVPEAFDSASPSRSGTPAPASPLAPDADDELGLGDFDTQDTATHTRPQQPPPTLPFTFPCPRTHDELLELLEQHHVQPSQLNLVITRIRTLYAPNLDEKNPARLQILLGVLLDHLLYRAAQGSRALARGGTQGHLEVLNDLVLHIHELAKAYPQRGAEMCISKLALMQRNLARGLSRGALQPTSLTWPGLAELCLLRVCGLVWPTSDRWHPVATPMSLLVAQYLAHARIRSLRDVASALYLCSLVTSYQAHSRRLVPEALNALYTVLAILLPLRVTKPRSVAQRIADEFGIPTPDVDAEHTAALRITQNAAPQSKANLGALLAARAPEAEAKATLLHVALELVRSFAKLYAGSPAFVELFTPFTFLLEVGAAPMQRAAPDAAAAVSETAAELRSEVERAAGARRALRLQSHRAVSIGTYAPRFDQQSFDPRRAADPDAERVQAAKLRAQLKKERKGAVRELRKDNQFIAQERERQRAEEDTAYNKKIDKIVGSLQTERSEEKQLDKVKAKIRKQAGRK